MFSVSLRTLILVLGMGALAMKLGANIESETILTVFFCFSLLVSGCAVAFVGITKNLRLEECVPFALYAAIISCVLGFALFGALIASPARPSGGILGLVVVAAILVSVLPFAWILLSQRRSDPQENDLV